MSRLSCGIVGLPNVGKSTLFNALTGSTVAASNYPFCTIDPNVGVVNVNDPRLPVLAQMSDSAKIVYATTTFVDIAGLVAGAASGEGLGNKFLANIRETDAIVHVVRCFENDDVVHVCGGIDPISDIEVINLELILSDLEMCENSLSKLQKQARGKTEMDLAVATLQKIKAHLDQNKPVRALSLSQEEKASIIQYPFLTAKKTLYVANVSEKELPLYDNQYVQKVKEFAAKEGSAVVPICAKLEEDIAQITDPGERLEFLQSMGLTEFGLDRLIHASFSLLDLICFLTTGEIESRAWTITKGTTAVEAAGKIHTQIQKGFIRAEVIAYKDLIACGSRSACKDAGKLRFEGRDYVVQDGDVVIFMHN